MAHETGHRHHSGSIQEYAAHMIERLGGIFTGHEHAEPKHAAPEPKPAADEWDTADEWAAKHSRKAGA